MREKIAWSWLSQLGMETERALKVPDDLVGIDNRDLLRFETDLETTPRLAPVVPKDRSVVSACGIQALEDAKRPQDGGN